MDRIALDLMRPALSPIRARLVMRLMLSLNSGGKISVVQTETAPMPVILSMRYKRQPFIFNDRQTASRVL